MTRLASRFRSCPSWRWVFFWCLPAVLLLMGARPASAQPGTSGSFSLLRLDASARAAALGGSFAAVDDGDVSALFYNPALLREASHRRVALSYLNHIGDLNAGFLAGAYHVEGLGTFGAGLRFLSWGAIEGANAIGERTGSFGAGDLVLTAGFARALGPRWRYGVNVHVLYSYIEATEAAALAADLGVRYRCPVSSSRWPLPSTTWATPSTRSDPRATRCRSTCASASRSGFATCRYSSP